MRILSVAVLCTNHIFFLEARQLPLEASLVLVCGRFLWRLRRDLAVWDSQTFV